MSTSLPTRSNQPRGPLILATAIIGLLALNWLAAVARFQVNALYWDQWDFCAPLFNELGWLDLFTQQHGPHRQGLAFVLTSWVMEASHWDSRVESLWVASLLVVAAILGVAWKRRLTGCFGWLDLWIPFAALAMCQYETVILVPNASHSIFPLVLMLLGAIVLTGATSMARWISLGVIGSAALFTGFGIFVWLGLGWVAGLRVLRSIAHRQTVSALGPLAGFAVLLAALAWFAHGYVFNPASAGATFPHWPLADYPKFVALMLASRMELTTPTTIAGAAGTIMLGLGTAGWAHASWKLWRDPQPAPGHVVAAYLLAAGLSFAWFTASGRVHLGVEAGMAPRYTSLLLSFWLGLMAWSTARELRLIQWGVVLVAWIMVVLPWVDLRDRELKDWPGTLGLSKPLRDALNRSQGNKTEWLLAWQETGGDWLEIERGSPTLIHPDPKAAQLDQKVDYLRKHHLSFAARPEVPLAWLPWWNPIGVTWIKGTGGEHAQWMAEEALILIEGRSAGYLNLRLRWVAPAFGAEYPLDIEFGHHRARVTYEQLLQGVSVPAPRKQTMLVLRSPDGAVPLDPPHDLRAGSFLVENPSLSADPQFVQRNWMKDEPGLWMERSLEIGDGFHQWEGGGKWVWSEARAELVCRAWEASFLNVNIESRYGPVNDGPVILRIDGVEIVLPWVKNDMRFSVPVPAGRARRIELINQAGAMSPREHGESNDGRQLALRIGRLSLDEKSAFTLVDPAP